MTISNAREVGHFLGGDATVAPSAEAHMATQHTPYMEVGIASGAAIPMASTSVHKRTQQHHHTTHIVDEPPSKKPKKQQMSSADRAHNVSNGQFTTNCRGVKLCSFSKPAHAPEKGLQCRPPVRYLLERSACRTASKDMQCRTPASTACDTHAKTSAGSKGNKRRA